MGAVNTISPLKKVKSLGVNEMMTVPPDQIADFLPKLDKAKLRYTIKRSREQGYLVIERTA
jgi:hypothetical protein